MEKITYIHKERRVEPILPGKYEKDDKKIQKLVLWRNDCGNAAAAVLVTQDVSCMQIDTCKMYDSAGNEAEGIQVEARFQKYVSTYRGCNGFPVPRPFIPPELRRGTAVIVRM